MFIKSFLKDCVQLRGGLPEEFMHQLHVNKRSPMADGCFDKEEGHIPTAFHWTALTSCSWLQVMAGMAVLAMGIGQQQQHGHWCRGWRSVQTLAAAAAPGICAHAFCSPW